MRQPDVEYEIDWHPPGELGVFTGCGNEERRTKVRICSGGRHLEVAANTHFFIQVLTSQAGFQNLKLSPYLILSPNISQSVASVTNSSMKLTE